MIHLVITVLMWFSLGLSVYLIYLLFRGKAGLVGAIMAILLLGFGAGTYYHRAYGSHPIFATPLPKGVKNSDKVVELALKRSKLSYQPSIAETLGENMDNGHQIQVMINPKTKRYVFNYKFKGKTIPVYAVYEKITPLQGSSFYDAFLIPVKKSKIDSLLTNGHVADKQIKAKEYQGYSYSDLELLMPDDSFDGQSHPNQKSYKQYEVTYK